jgi:hypothetical protein
LALRQVASDLDLDKAVSEHLVDRRMPGLVTHPLATLVRTSVLLSAQGWRDQDDADRLRNDGAMVLAVTGRRGAAAGDYALASQPTMSRTMAMLADEGNLGGLREVSRTVAFNGLQRAFGRRAEMTIDVDSLPQEAHGSQEGAVYNGHYHYVCFHPLVAVADGYILDGIVRPGNVHTAEQVQRFVAPLITRALGMADKVWLRMDAGFALPEFMDFLDDQGVAFISRLRNTKPLQRQVQRWVEKTQASWRKSPSETLREATFETRYRTKTSWSRSRRVIAVLVERSGRDGELFDNLFFLVTNAARREGGSRALLERYRLRGRAENTIGEFVNVVAPKVSHHGMDTNQAAQLLAIVAYNLMHHLRVRLERLRKEGLSLNQLRERFLKAASHIIRHARQISIRIGRSKVAAWRLLAKALAPDLVEEERAR